MTMGMDQSEWVKSMLFEHTAWPHSIDPKAVEKLLDDEGANANAHDRFLWTPLHFTAANPTPNTDVVIKTMQVLVERGGDVLAMDFNGASPLTLAICRKDRSSAIADAFFAAAVNQSKNDLPGFVANMSRLAEVSVGPTKRYLRKKLPTVEIPPAP